MKKNTFKMHMIIWEIKYDLNTSLRIVNKSVKYNKVYINKSLLHTLYVIIINICL